MNKVLVLGLGVVALVMTVVADAALPCWRGEAFRSWEPNDQLADLTIKDGALCGRVTGSDSQFAVTLDKPFCPKGNQFLKFRVKAAKTGEFQFFWIREGDAGASADRQLRFNVVGEGGWREVSVRIGWTGKRLIRAFRFDFPWTYACGTNFELADVRFEEEGEAQIIDANRMRGVAFSLKMPAGLHYAQLAWSGEEGPGIYGFTTATDGERHEYWCELKKSRAPRFAKNWKGEIVCFEVTRPFTGEKLPVENMRFLAEMPKMPADPVVTSVFPNEAIPRAGRPFVVEAVVRNFGTLPAEQLRFSFEGLPNGVKARRPVELTPTEPLAGCDGTETINNDCREMLAHERVYRIMLDDLGVGTHDFTLVLEAKGVAARRYPVHAEVLPSLNLAKVDYPSEPKPINTAPYELGALIFPGWVTHKWHAVWSHEPQRKPLLGWYDESKPETIDWQIKYLVEHGISFVSVDWYWKDGKPVSPDHWIPAFAKARYRKYLKWHIMWDNSTNSAEDQEIQAKYLCENLFTDPQYHKIDGKPVITICSARSMEERMRGKGGARRLIEITNRIAREHGLPGVFYVGLRGMGADADDAGFLTQFGDAGFDLTSVYGFRGGIPGTKYSGVKRIPYPWLVEVSPAHWRALAKNSVVPFWPSISTGYDDRPWRGERVLEIYDYNVKDFQQHCRDAKAFSDESGIRTFLVGPLDEWGEGSIGYPNREHGFGIFDALRDTFGHKPVDGWPLDYAPEDVGLTCPQLLR